MRSLPQPFFNVPNPIPNATWRQPDEGRPPAVVPANFKPLIAYTEPASGHRGAEQCIVCTGVCRFDQIESALIEMMFLRARHLKHDVLFVMFIAHRR
jgi:hypothetical protein